MNCKRIIAALFFTLLFVSQNLYGDKKAISELLKLNVKDNLVIEDIYQKDKLSIYKITLPNEKLYAIKDKVKAKSTSLEYILISKADFTIKSVKIMDGDKRNNSLTSERFLKQFNELKENEILSQIDAISGATNSVDNLKKSILMNLRQLIKLEKH